MILNACLPRWGANCLAAQQFGNTDSSIVHLTSCRFPWMKIPLRHRSHILLFNRLLREAFLHNEAISYYRGKTKKESFIPHKKQGCQKVETLSIGLNHSWD